MKTLLYSISLPILCLSFGFILMASGCAEQAAPPSETPEAPAQAAEPVVDLEVGKASFIEHCGTCHGESGTVKDADPEMLALLESTPPDLTQLTKEYGEFPTEFITKTVDGRQQFKAHGTREMPIWGEIWTQKEGEAAVDPKVASLVAYIQSIQQ